MDIITISDFEQELRRRTTLCGQPFLSTVARNSLVDGFTLFTLFTTDWSNKGFNKILRSVCPHSVLLIPHGWEENVELVVNSLTIEHSLTGLVSSWRDPVNPNFHHLVASDLVTATFLTLALAR